MFLVYILLSVGVSLLSMQGIYTRPTPHAVGAAPLPVVAALFLEYSFLVFDFAASSWGPLGLSLFSLFF